MLMGKNSKKLRRQEFPDHEEMEDFERLSRKSRTDSSEKSSGLSRPPAVGAPAKIRSDLKEGSLVSHGNVHGVLFQVVGESILILDAQGIIHEIPHKEVYPSQE